MTFSPPSASLDLKVPIFLLIDGPKNRAQLAQVTSPPSASLDLKVPIFLLIDGPKNRAQLVQVTSRARRGKPIVPIVVFAH